MIEEHVKWCRDFIEHRCVFRSPQDKPLLTAAGGGLNTYQFYLPIALLDQEFRRRIALLFWHHYIDEFKRRPFQICGCESGGVALICALQSAVAAHGIAVNVFAIKKQAKSYGIKNWIEGMVLEGIPVLLVDDVVGRKATVTTQATRLTEFGLEVMGAFCVAACKLNPPLVLEFAGRSVELKTFLGADDFTRSHGAYINKYGKAPEFHGSTV